MIADRELLELAAKAAGIELAWSDDGRAGYYSDWRGLPQWDEWNPLTDDGDALRLAVKLEIAPFYCEMTGEAEARYRHGSMRLTEYGPDDPYAATRRAIVRAAAEIGRAQ